MKKRLTPKEIEQNRFERALDTSLQYTLNTLKNQAAAKLQECIRAEFGASTDVVCVWTHGVSLNAVPSGFCACVTCGVWYPWRGSNKIDTGHYLASRRNSILFDERGMFPQCSYCNRSGGMPQRFRDVMLTVHGEEVIEDLQRLKHQGDRKFSREELVQMRLAYMDRTKAAIKRMKNQS